MRRNLPVTATEYPIPQDATLVSTTDLKGRILHCNPSFMEVSGFTAAELIGKPHNLIRHPDMPEEAFRDLWATIRQGRPWTALVKNRRKNGDFYWVQANVTPLMDGDQPVGYMSVRTCPSRQQVQAAERLYRQMREQQADGRPRLRLRHGRVERLGIAAAFGRMLTPALPVRIGLLAPATVLAGFGIGLAAGGGWRSPAPAWAFGALAAGALGAGLALLLQRWTSGPMVRLLRTAHRVAAGDLTQRTEAHDGGLAGELAQALDQVVLNLRAMVRDARDEVRRIEGATGEVATGSHDLSARTEAQAANLQQTAASMEEITGTVRGSAEAARQAAERAEQAHGIAREGRTVVEGVTTTMRAIAQSSGRIAEILQVIDSISFQTNILALNAAVEAARAGEQGRGFAVVAAEVRALARRTTEAAREIKGLIDVATGRVDDGERQVAQAQAAMERALGAVSEVNSLISQISSASHEQLGGVSQINDALGQLDGITQQNAAMVEQLGAAAQALRQQAQVVSSAVKVFRV